jgi:adenine-specific DNA-methyltransferase
MAVGIRYMGNKKQIARDVGALVDELRPGRPLLDLFCGMCSVAGAVSDSGRHVWANDVQRYAAHAARCLIATKAPPPPAEQAAAILATTAQRHREQLAERFAASLSVEDEVLADPTVEAYGMAYRQWRHAANDAAVAAEVFGLRRARRAVPYRLATLTFAWGYFGLRQAIDIDSLRYAIDRHGRNGNLSPTDRRWALLALLQTASQLAASPGHLAQYLSATTPPSLERVVRQRRRNIERQFEIELGRLAPYGAADWRGNNVVMCRDALGIWRELATRGFHGNVIYADPPYSKNQYSRFYHVLETLHRYDYPTVSGRGRYRPDRHVTTFSQRRGVAAAFDALCAGAARLDCALVLSYPSDGLLSRYGKGDVTTILGRHFPRVRVALCRPLTHSTLGSAHGVRDNTVEERVYVAMPR